VRSTYSHQIVALKPHSASNKKKQIPVVEQKPPTNDHLVCHRDHVVRRMCWILGTPRDATRNIPHTNSRPQSLTWPWDHMLVSLQRQTNAMNLQQQYAWNCETSNSLGFYKYKSFWVLAYIRNAVASIVKAISLHLLEVREQAEISTCRLLTIDTACPLTTYNRAYTEFSFCDT